jgi:mRNA-degrading endonuclease RelE of RelBE toxin-antitoxin system
MTLRGRTPRRRLLVNRTGVETLLELSAKIQQQVLRKMETIEAAPASAGYPLRKPLQGFRGIHSGRYRIIWRLLTLEGDEQVAEVVYVGIRSEGDERDAYAEFTKLFGLPNV